MSTNIPIVQNIMNANDLLASQIHDRLSRAGVYSMNVMASPGGGKTTTILRTVRTLMNEIQIGVMDGDVVPIDLEELAKMGIPVSLINTGGDCHLDANMVLGALPTLNIDALDLLIIENVGNLVCPANYDLGEALKVVVLSTTEGDDKPLKYPAMFRKSSVMILNKVDLLGTSEFDRETVKANALRINGHLKIFEVSCARGDGLDEWYRWLADAVRAKQNLARS
jgi:hydrogenase nickel incorporation protein HypB